MGLFQIKKYKFTFVINSNYFIVQNAGLIKHKLSKVIPKIGFGILGKSRKTFSEDLCTGMKWPMRPYLLTGKS